MPQISFVNRSPGPYCRAPTLPYRLSRDRYCSKDFSEWLEWMHSPVDDPQKGWLSWYSKSLDDTFDTLPRGKKLQAAFRRSRCV